ncbi:hypothetical protein P692DRAFT_20826384 [Suillus brevipes Sb2]|nr:hypothetical protein P692DRAFT_20826384 [Suillus brevipes Sb2]
MHHHASGYVKVAAGTSCSSVLLATDWVAGYAEMQGGIILQRLVLGVIAGSWMVLKLLRRDSSAPNVGEESMKVDICEG